jgi:hypothetical protein
MITREQIVRGFHSGTISLENEYSGCTSLCCRIGQYAFYFAGMEDEDLSVKEYLKNYAFDEIVENIFSVLKDSASAEDNGIYDEEYSYYEYLLA